MEGTETQGTEPRCDGVGCLAQKIGERCGPASSCGSGPGRKEGDRCTKPRNNDLRTSERWVEQNQCRTSSYGLNSRKWLAPLKSGRLGLKDFIVKWLLVLGLQPDSVLSVNRVGSVGSIYINTIVSMMMAMAAKEETFIAISASLTPQTWQRRK